MGRPLRGRPESAGRFPRCLAWLWLALGGLLGPGTGHAQNFVGNASPDILWRRQSLADTALWEMDGVAFKNGHFIGWSGSDTQWKIVGMADFGYWSNNAAVYAPDGKPDILWQHQTVNNSPGVWLMNGASWVGGFSLTSLPGSGWKFVGAGDFGSVVNGQPSTTTNGLGDIVLEHAATGQMQFWLLNGANVVTNAPESLPTGWRICSVGDFGTPTSSTPDGKPDLVLAHYGTGHVAIRYLNGYQTVSSHDVWNKAGTNSFLLNFVHQLDMEIVGAADYTQDGKTDLLVRIGTDGRHKIWQMNGTNFLGELDILNSFNGYQPLHTYETDWRMNTQAITNNAWRLRYMEGTPNNIMLITAAGVATSTPRIDLTWHHVLSGFPVTIRRQPFGAGAANWANATVLASGWTNPTYSDYAVQSDVLYEYQVTGSGLPVMYTAGVVSSVGHQRGRVLLAVDNTLASQIETGLNTLTADLIGDGWTVKRTNVARYQDPAWNAANAAAMQDLKTWIVNSYNQDPTNTKCVLLIGHVPIPYSGNEASDGHTETNNPPSHANPWTADAYYGDVVGPTWTDSGNGQFTNNEFPSPLELAVGRIDFARLTHLLTNQTEAQLINQYIDKAHNYRRKQSPFHLDSKVAYFSYHMNGSLGLSAQPLTARRIGHLLSPQWLDSVTIADPFRNSATFQNSTPPVSALFAIAAGNGDFPEIYNNIAGGKYTSQMIVNNSEPASAIWMINGSYFTDFNAPNNFPRSILGKPNFALIVLPASDKGGGPLWRMDVFLSGQPIGQMFRASTEFLNSERKRWLCLLGDPTLRYDYAKPPTLLSATRSGGTVTLQWSAGESGQQFHIYRAGTTNGPFSLLTTNGVLSSNQFSWAVTDVPTNRVYMVRGLHLTSTASSSFWNLSQGSVKASD